MPGDTLTTRRTLYLVDGTYTVFRSYFAIARLSAADGTVTNGVLGFLNTMRKLIRERCPDHLGIAFDVEGPTHRDGQYAEYKANRAAPPEDLQPQFALAMEASRLMGWPVLTAPGYEADDVLATLAREGRERGLDVVVVTSDKDLYQLVADGIVVQNPAKEDRVLDAEGVRDVFGVLPTQVVDVLALMGDAVDNVPGVPGIGEKTAKTLVQRYGGVDAILDRARRFAELWEARQRAIDALDAGDDARLHAALLELKEPCRTLAELETTLGGEPADDLCARFGAAAALSPDTNPRALKKALLELEKKTQSKTWLALAGHVEAAGLSRELVTVRTDAPVVLDLEAMHPKRPDREGAAALFRRLGFRTWTEEMESDQWSALWTGVKAPAAEAAAIAVDVANDLFGESAAPCEEPAGPPHALDMAVERLADDAALARWLDAAPAGDTPLAVVVEPGAGDRRPALVGVALSTSDAHTAWFAVDHASETPRPAWENARAQLAHPLGDAARLKAGHDLKSARALLRRRGVPLAGPLFDTMIAAQLLDPDRNASQRLDDLAQRLLGVQMTAYGDAFGRGAAQRPLEAADPETVARYAGEAAAVIRRLVPALREELRRADLLELFETVEMPLVSVLDDMETAGIRVDVARLGAMSTRLDQELAALEGQIHALAGRAFNINSPPQLRAVLFDELQLKPTRRTQKTRVHSTGSEVLEQLVDAHPLPAKVLEYRELSKLKGTYVDALPKLIDPADGRLHTRFNQIGAATGRLSSSDPNLQNIPIRTESGRLIRAAFVPEPGWTFVSADYSQMELRILAHLAEDPQLIEAFDRGLDIHRYTAALVAGIEMDEVTPALRAAAKAVNFGIVYGMSEYRLARDQDMSIEEARLFIANYFARYPRIREYIDGTIREVLRDGEVRTLFGRVRRFPELTLGADPTRRLSRPAREALLRQAVNATVQGTGADIVKRAMVRIAERFRSQGLKSRLLLQVHDELLFEAVPDELPVVEAVVRAGMEGAANLRVPLAVDLRTGESWSAAH